MDKNTQQESVELEQFNIIAKIPVGTIRVEIIAKYADDDGEIHIVKKFMNAREIMTAREDFLDNVEDGDDYDTRYVITETGEKFLRELHRRGDNGNPEREDFDD